MTASTTLPPRTRRESPTPVLDERRAAETTTVAPVPVVPPPDHPSGIAHYFESLHGTVEPWDPSRLLDAWVADFGNENLNADLLNFAANVWSYKKRDPLATWGENSHVAARRAHGLTSEQAAPDAGPRFAPMTVDSWFAKEYPETQDLIEGLLPDEGYGAIIASEKVGKSLLAMQLALSVASGTDFMGRRVRQAPTLFIEEEGSERKARERLFKQATKFDGMARGIPAHFVHGQQLRLDSPADLAALDDLIRETGAKLVMLGPLAQIADLADENAATEMAKINRTLTALSKRHHCVVLLIHHRRKDDEYRSVRAFFTTTRGSNALMAAIDVAIGLDRDVEEAEGKFLVLQRDGLPSKEGYTLDPTSLCAFPSAIPDRRKAPPTAVYDLLLAEPDAITPTRFSYKLGVDRKTAETRLEELQRDGRAVVEHTKGTASYWRAIPVAETLATTID